MMNTSSSWVLRGLIIEMKPSVSNLNEYISCTRKFSIENDLASKAFLIELDALLNIRSKNMDVMDVTNQVGLSFW
jgi:hypothetical protein